MFSNDPVTKSKEEASIPSCCCTHTVPAFYYARGRARTPHSAEMAARIGWNTVYSTLQLSRLRRLFEQRQKGPEDNDRGTFDDWNKCRSEDGILCRDSEDCVWIDSNLYCDESGLNFTPEVSGTVPGHKGDPHSNQTFGCWGQGGSFRIILGHLSCLARVVRRRRLEHLRLVQMLRHHNLQRFQRRDVVRDGRHAGCRHHGLFSDRGHCKLLLRRPMRLQKDRGR